MIANETKKIVELLLSLPEVVEWCGKDGTLPAISAYRHINADTLPAITVWEVENFPTKFGDNQELASFYAVEIRITSKEGTHNNVLGPIHEAMEQNGYFRMRQVPVRIDERSNTLTRTIQYGKELYDY